MNPAIHDLVALLAEIAVDDYIEGRTMTRARYNLLMTSDSEPLTDAEIKEGWHFCCEWDGLLIHPDDEEAKCCTCNESS